MRVEVRERLPHGLGPSVADTIGEVVTKGPHIMSGYIGLSRTTLDAFTSDSWLRTGDIGYMKGGRLFLVGRLHDVIKSGGEKIFAGEVEMTLTAHPLVREAAVVGIPHRILGEAVAAAVVLANNCPSAENVLKGVRDFCRDCLAAYKCPKWILAQKGLPKNANGKVVKEKLRQILQVTFQPRLAKL